MKKSLGATTLLYPTPVLLVGTYDQQSKPNLMAAAWGGICCSKPPCVAVALRKATYSYNCISERKAFTVGIGSEDKMRETDFCGMYSGRELDKFAAAGLTPVHSESVDAPYAAEIPLVLECRLLHTLEIGLHTQFIGEIMNVLADEAVLDENGKPDIMKIKPLIFDPGLRNYHGVSQAVGKAYQAPRDLRKQRN